MQRFVRTAAIIAGLAGAVTLASGVGCGSSKKSSGGGGATAPTSELNFKIQSAEFASPTAAPTVTFSVTDAQGKPVDLPTAIATPAAQGGFTPKFVLAQREPDGTYTNMYEAPRAGRQFVFGGTTRDPALATATQPNYDPPAGGPFPTANLAVVDAGAGVYKYTFSKPPTTAAAKIDRNKSFLAGVYSHRVVNGADQPGSDTFAFVPATGAAGDRTSIIDEAACNRCHNNPRLEAHDSRVGVSLCLACHAGDQTGAAPAYQDPESGNDIDFRAMIHKIHAGSSLPANAQPYYIVGFTTQATGPIPETSVSDWSDVDFPPDVRSCQTCHQGSATVAPQLDNWKTHANAKACTACHTYVKFDGSAPGACALGVHDAAGTCNHPAGVTLQTDCSSCHAAGVAALGPDKVHVPPYVTADSRFKYEITSATVGADRKVTVQFRVVDPSQSNKPWDIKADAPFTAAGGNSSLNVRFAWPTPEYTNEASNQSYGQPDTVNALTAATPVTGQAGVFQAVSNVPVPAAVNDVTVAIEGHPFLADLSGVATAGERMPVASLVQTIGVGGGAGQARRQVVSADKCNACHGSLSAHGSNRNGTPAVCVVCHNPEATDKARRVGVPGEQTIDFKVLIHAVHAGDIRQTPFDVYGFGNALNEFPAPYPGQVANCALCHVNTSYALPLSPAVHDTTIDTGADPKLTTDNVRRKAATAACTSCHDYVKFDGTGAGDCQQGVKETAACNHVAGVSATTDCAACHTSGGVGVGTVHPIAQP